MKHTAFRLLISISMCFLLSSLSPAGAETKYFSDRLTLPDFPKFSVFVQKESLSRASKLKDGKRWEISRKPDHSTKHYLLVSPKKNLWISLSLLQTPHGGRKPLTWKQFDAEMTRFDTPTKSKVSGKTLPTTKKYVTKGKKTVKSKKAGELGYYSFKHKDGKHGTLLLFIPGQDKVQRGNKRAIILTVTHTGSSAGQAKQIIQSCLDHMEVSSKL